MRLIKLDMVLIQEYIKAQSEMTKSFEFYHVIMRKIN